MLIQPTPIQHVQLEFRPYFDWRVRVERRLDRDFYSPTDDNRSDVLNRFRPGVEWSYGKEWSGEVQYQLATGAVKTNAIDFTDDASDVGLAYARYRKNGLDVTAGRQKIAIGSERLIGPLEWSLTARSFDGVRVRLGRWDAFAFKVGVALPKPGKQRIAGTTYKSGLGLTSVIFKHDAAAAGDTDLWTLAQTWERKWGKWAFETEDAVQFGNTAGKTLRAWAVHANLSYAASKQTKPWVEFNAASGGGNATTTYTFDNLLPTNHKFYGSMDLQGWRNMQEIAVGVDHQFNPKWSGKAHFHSFSLRDASDAWYGAGGGVNRGGFGAFADPTGASGRDLGRELDLEVTYKHNARMTFSGGVGAFWPGGFVKSLNGGRADTQYWGFLSAQFRF